MSDLLGMLANWLQSETSADRHMIAQPLADAIEEAGCPKAAERMRMIGDGSVVMLTVYDDGSLIEQSLHLTQALADKHLADLVREWWEEQDHDDGDRPLPDDDDDAVEAYFDFWDPEQGYTTDVLPVNFGSLIPTT